MHLRHACSTLWVGLSLLAGAAGAGEAGPIKVVASFSILGDMVRRIGGDHIAMTTLVGPGGDAHVYEPSPSDVRAVGEAKVLVVNGLQFEGWLPRLVETAEFKGEEVVATTGLQPIPFAGTEEAAEPEAGGQRIDDPHAWQDLANGVVYAENIVKGLSAADPANAADYRAKGDAFIAGIKAMDADVKSALAAIPEARRKVVTSHDAFGYFARAYGVDFIAPEGVSTESEASAGDVARIIDQIKKDNISAVFVENISDTRLVEQIASETTARIGGTLYSDALSGPDGPASTYLEMFRNNTSQIIEALNTN